MDGVDGIFGTHRLVDSSEPAAFVHTLVQLGKVLALENITEGIETDDQRMRLRAENIDNGQGYLFARPLDVEAVERLLNGSASSTGVSAPVR